MEKQVLAARLADVNLNEKDRYLTGVDVPEFQRFIAAS
jgi:hypothetical protein